MTSSPRHHLPEDLVADYVAGNTSEAVSLVVACHLTLCARCTASAAAFERAAGQLIEGATTSAVSPEALARTLSRLDDAAPSPASAPPAASVAGVDLPRPLLRYLDPAGPRWHRLLPGIQELRLPVATPGTTVRLVRLAPNVTIPLHTHEGRELTVVFSGGIDDGSALYERGDIDLRGGDDRHVQRIRPGATCIALAVNHGNLVPLTIRGRLFKLLTGA